MALPPQPRTAISLFSGGGGLDLGLRLAVPSLRTVCYCERDAYAAAVLVARVENADLDQAPVWDDVASFCGQPWRGRVDLIAGGFPCQDISNSGKRAGINGERSGLWREYARIISEVHPRWVFVENVAALTVRGLDRILSDLAALGFDAEWATLRASAIGAPHHRDRLFILAHAISEREPQPSGVVGEIRRRVGDAREAVAHAQSGRLKPWLPDAQRSRRTEAQCDRRHSDEFPPGPRDLSAWMRVLKVRPTLEPAVCRMADGLADRVDRLRVLGNGVVPAQAAAAYRALRARFA